MIQIVRDFSTDSLYFKPPGVQIVLIFCFIFKIYDSALKSKFNCLFLEDSLPQGFPTMTVSPRTLYLTEGDTAVLPCKAIGNPKPKVRWFLSHAPLTYTDPRMKMLPDNSLQIVNVTMGSMRLFECEVSNSVGRRISRRVGIFVKEREGVYFIISHLFTFGFDIWLPKVA